jgi:hypothetical protein
MMIDPISIGLAVVAAKAIVHNVREVVNLGHDIASLGGELSGFFKTQGQVEKAKEEAQAKADDPNNTDENATSLAFDIVMKAEEMKKAEQELRDLFSLTGRMDLYQQLCEQRDKIIGKRNDAAKQKKLAAAAKKRKHDDEMQQIQVFFAIVFALVIVGGICWGTYWVLFDEESPFVQQSKPVAKKRY